MKTGFAQAFLHACALLGLFVAHPIAAQAATIVDLTTAGSSGTINGAIYQQVPEQSTGTGTIDSFAQIGGNATTSRAYNTTVNNVLDNGSADNFNHSITLGLVPVVNVSGTPYRQFLLDVNESAGGGNNMISLDEIQIFVGGTANSNVTSFASGILGHNGTLVYRMDTVIDDNWVALNYSLNTGSGSGDMFLYVQQSLFASYAASDVVTLYSQFGLQGVNPATFTGNFGTSAGFEEWAVLEVPEPATCALLMLGLLPLMGRRRV